MGYGSADSSGKKCTASNCSSLKYSKYTRLGAFDGDQSGFVLQSSEDKMPDILSVLGDNFVMGAKGYPILKWQTESNF